MHVDGPRFFHLVAGGSTPAALGGDMLCSVFDQHAFASMSSPAAVRLEQAMISWLKDLFDLPSEFGGGDGHRGNDGELHGPVDGSSVVR